MHYKKVMAWLLAAALCLQGVSIPAAAAETDVIPYSEAVTEEVPDSGMEASDDTVHEEGQEETELPEEAQEGSSEDEAAPEGAEEQEPVLSEEAAGATAAPAEEEPPEEAAAETPVPESTEEAEAEEARPESTKEDEEEQEAPVISRAEEETAGREAREEAVSGETADVTVTILNPDSFTYTGYAIEPLIAVTAGSDSLGEGTDYTVTYENNVNAGTATGHVKGIGNYSFDKAFTFEISKHVLEAGDVQTSLNGYAQRYNSHAYGVNRILVAVGSKILAKGTDYTISGEEDFNNSVSGAEAVITGTGNCSGSVTVSIPEYDPVTYDIQGSFVYGEPEDVSVTVKAGSRTLTQGSREGEGDYYVTTKATSDTMVEVSVNGEYDGAELYEYKIFRVSSRALKDPEVTLSGTQFAYTGSAVRPEVTVTVNGKELEEKTDYVLSYKNNTAKGTASVSVTGTGHYTGTVTKTFEITDGTAPAGPEITISLAEGADAVYDGEPKTPAFVVKADGVALTAGVDYTISYTDNVNAGTAAAHIRGKGAYSFSKDVSFTISPYLLGVSDVALDAETAAYTGKEVRPAVTVRVSLPSGSAVALTEGRDYEVRYTDNVNVGTAKAVVTGMGCYIGTVEKEFRIEKGAGETGDTITVSAELKSSDPIIYDGTPKTPALSVKVNDGELVQDIDYYVTYKDNVNVGSATAHVKSLKNDVPFETDVRFGITARPLEAASVTLDKVRFEFTGAEIRPEVTVVVGRYILQQGTDYTVRYVNNKAAGTAGAVISGAGNYQGTVEKAFEITSTVTRITPAVSLSAAAFTYNGKVQKPAVTVRNGSTMLSASDYSLTWSGRSTDAGTYTVTVTMKGRYAGTAKASYRIAPKKITPAVVLSSKKLEYNGKVRRPSVRVKNGGTVIPSSQYTVTYSGGRKNVGTYKLTVRMKGNYSGSRTVSFSIVPRATKITRFKPVTGKLAFDIRWKKQSKQVTGYLLQYSTDKNFKKNVKTVTVKGAGRTGKIITGVKAGKYYYVRIRTYKVIGKKRYYSPWTF